MVHFRRPYEDHDRVTVHVGDVSLTKQSFKDQCDINRIIAKYRATGLVDHVNKYQGQYADVSGDVDYQTALNTIMAADEAFMSLPANIRERFNNNPAEFLDFVDNPDNISEMAEMGLLSKTPPLMPSDDNNVNNDEKIEEPIADN